MLHVIVYFSIYECAFCGLLLLFIFGTLLRSFWDLFWHCGAKGDLFILLGKNSVKQWDECTSCNIYWFFWHGIRQKSKLNVEKFVLTSENRWPLDIDVSTSIFYLNIVSLQGYNTFEKVMDIYHIPYSTSHMKWLLLT